MLVKGFVKKKGGGFFEKLLNFINWNLRLKCQFQLRSLLWAFTVNQHETSRALFGFLSRALRVKNETSISENLAREGDTPIKIGVGDRLLKQIFISKHISLKVRLCYFSVRTPRNSTNLPLFVCNAFFCDMCWERWDFQFWDSQWTRRSQQEHVFGIV